MFKKGDVLIYLRDKRSGLHKVEIEQCSKTGKVKIFSSDMAFSYWVDGCNFRPATKEERLIRCRIDDK